MKRRYDLRRSDNYMYSGKVSYLCSGSGTLYVYTGFQVTSATVSFATIPCDASIYYSSSSSSGSSSSSSSLDYSVSSSSSSIDSHSSNSSYSSSSSSSSSVDSSSSSSSSSSEIIVIEGCPRVYVSGYASEGFYVTYEGITRAMGYIEFSYTAV